MLNDIDITSPYEISVNGVLISMSPRFENGMLILSGTPENNERLEIVVTFPEPIFEIPDKEGQHHLELDETKLESKGKSVSIDEVLAKIDEALI